MPYTKVSVFFIFLRGALRQRRGVNTPYAGAAITADHAFPIVFLNEEALEDHELGNTHKKRPVRK